MGKITDKNFIHVSGWMVNNLELKGNELLIYAIIYGFSQAEDQAFSGSLQYLADWTNTSKQSVLNNLKSLQEKGYITKTEKMLNGVKFCSYKCDLTLPVFKKVEWGSQKSCTGGSQKSLPNNIEIDNIEDKIDNNIWDKTEEKPEKKRQKADERFCKPTVEDVKAYCCQRGNHVDAERFISHYESNGWKVGRNPMKDWKAAVRTWERSSYESPPKPNRQRDASLDDLF